MGEEDPWERRVRALLRRAIDEDWWGLQEAVPPRGASFARDELAVLKSALEALLEKIDDDRREKERQLRLRRKNRSAALEEYGRELAAERGFEYPLETSADDAERLKFSVELLTQHPGVKYVTGNGKRIKLPDPHPKDRWDQVRSKTEILKILSRLRGVEAKSLEKTLERAKRRSKATST